MSSQEGPVGVAEGLARLITVLEDGERRASFAQDSQAAMREAGIPPGAIPPRTMETLESLSDTELAAFSKVGKGLIDDGLYLNLPGDIGRVFFF